MLSELNDRSREILRCIVESYVETGEPIGSRTISKRLNVSLSPASVRNVMADLEETGENWETLVQAMRLYFSIQHVSLTEGAANGMYSNQTTNTYEFTPQKFAFAYLNLETVDAKERLKKAGSLQLQSDMMASPEFSRYRGWVSEMNNRLRPHLDLIRRARGKGEWPLRYHEGDREPTPYRLESVGFTLRQVNVWLKEHEEMEKLRPKRVR